MTNRDTDRGIQLLRVAACLCVFFCHFGQRMSLNRLSTDLYAFSQLGRYGVELFFVISGYLACISLSSKQSVGVFYKKRAIRILPLYYFCIGYFFLTETFLFHSIPEDPLHLGWLRYIFCLNGIVPSEGYFWSNIGITWTIPIFLIFYIAAPFLCKIAKTSARAALLLLASLGLALFVKTSFHGWFSALLYMPCFLIGILVYHAKRENHAFLICMALLLFVFAAKFGDWGDLVSSIASKISVVCASAVFGAMLLLSDRFIVTRKRVMKILDFLDEHSYTVYLVHGITFCGILDKVGAQVFGNTLVTAIFRLTVSIFVTGILTLLIHKYIEKPIQKRLSKALLQ